MADEKRRVYVTIPITGSVTIEVEVDASADDDDIVAAAMDAYNPKEHDTEWEFTPTVSSGNVCHAMCMSYDITEAD